MPLVVLDVVKDNIRLMSTGDVTSGSLSQEYVLYVGFRAERRQWMQRSGEGVQTTCVFTVEAADRYTISVAGLKRVFTGESEQEVCNAVTDAGVWGEWRREDGSDSCCLDFGWRLDSVQDVLSAAAVHKVPTKIQRCCPTYAAIPMHATQESLLAPLSSSSEDEVPRSSASSAASSSGTDTYRSAEARQEPAKERTRVDTVAAVAALPRTRPLCAVVLDAANMESTRSLAHLVDSFVLPNRDAGTHAAMLLTAEALGLAERCTMAHADLKAQLRTLEAGSVDVLLADGCGQWRNIAPSVQTAFDRCLFGANAVVCVTSYVVRESGVKSCDLQRAMQQEFMAMATASGYQFADTQATNYGKSSAMLFFMARLVRKC